MGVRESSSSSSASAGTDENGGEEVGPSTNSSATARGGVRMGFPMAAQPEIMRAAEKDEQYASFVYDACRDAFRHLFGLLSLSLSLS